MICLSLCPGLIKSKKYDWKDSNLALFGSDLERNVKSNTFNSSHSISCNCFLLLYTSKQIILRMCCNLLLFAFYTI